MRTGDYDMKNILIALLLVTFTVSASAATPAQQTFATPEDAATALVQAAKSGDTAAIRTVLGNAPGSLSSGDAVADRALRESFVTAYEAKHAVAKEGDVAKLTIGNDDFPFAFPIVKSGDRWRFDTDAGKTELLARRIGENEIDAINVLKAIVDAQQQYASADRNGDGVYEYARKFVSGPGRHDGLYWVTKSGEPPSPLGNLIGKAAGEGYKASKDSPTPYHGYYYRMLTGQGKDAPGGAIDYVVHGRTIGGFAVIAWPAKYASSGIMSFMVNQDGKVYQADLGANTAARAATIKRFNPDKNWSEVK